MNMFNFDEIESIYHPNSFMCHIENIVNDIEQSGFNIYEELNEFTINSILSEQINESYGLVFSDTTIENKNKQCGDKKSINKIESKENNYTQFDNTKCCKKKCQNKSLRDHICRMHLLLEEENKCIIDKCTNLKSRSNKKEKKYNDLCTRHLKNKRTKYLCI